MEHISLAAKTPKVSKQAFRPDRTATIQRYGAYIDLGYCLASRNLNLLTIRGSARLDMLAIISAADTVDMKANLGGIQRDLDKGHADECYQYAEESIDIPAMQEARAFPELMLNVRELSAVEFYNPDDPGELYELSSYMTEDELPRPLIGFRVSLERLELPHPDINPSISRFDENHRLSGMDRHLQEFFETGEPATTFEIPTVPYSLFIAVDTTEEKRLFNVINDKHKGMEAALLDAQTFDLTSEDKLKSSPKLLPLWFARKLADDPMAFKDMIFLGGGTRGYKEANQKLPPLRLNSLRSAISLMIRTGGAEIGGLIDEPDLFLIFINNYWRAVRAVFPEAWSNKREFILLQSIGLNGFAMLGGKLIKEMYETGGTSLDEKDFESSLRAIASQISLKRDDPLWDAVAGAGGARKVYGELVKRLTLGAANIEKLKATYLPKKTTSELINEA